MLLNEDEVWFSDINGSVGWKLEFVMIDDGVLLCGLYIADV